jgi:ACS family glucarate transporter-like MFS transporter
LPWCTSNFWFLFASYLLQGYVGYIFVFWFFSYLVQVRHFELLQAAGITALPWIATLIAIPAGGAISDAVVRRGGASWRRIVPMAALLMGAIALAIGARTSASVVAVGALIACTVLVLCTEGPFWAAMNEIAGARSGAAGGLMNFGSNLGGMISPALTPWLAKHIGWEGALSLTAGLAALAGLLWIPIRIGDRK